MELTPGELGRRTYSRVDLALFGAATWNPHLIHLSTEVAKEQGLPGVVVQSHFLPATLLAFIDARRLATDLRLQTLSWRNRSPVVPGDEVVFTITDVDHNGIATWVATVAERVVADGTIRFIPPLN
jgi:acyl dehydratase